MFEQWIIFKNLQLILLFLNIWTLTFYCFRLKKRDMHILRLSCLETLLGFLKSTLTFKTSIYSLGYGDHTTKRIIFVSFVKKISTICLKKKLIIIYKTRYKYFRSGIINVQNWRVCELLKCFLAIQKQRTNRPQVIANQTDHRWTFVTLERPWNI